jgi:hypothetical protein
MVDSRGKSFAGIRINLKAFNDKTRIIKIRERG